MPRVKTRVDVYRCDAPTCEIILCADLNNDVWDNNCISVQIRNPKEYFPSATFMFCSDDCLMSWYRDKVCGG